jgi:branched-chain amino acid transport system ATP-binding protein
LTKKGTKMLLELKDVSVHYGKVQVLKSISMIIKERTIVCLIGTNGAGKSTILRTISGLNRLTSGEIWFNGKRIDGLPVDERVGMGIVHVLEGRRVFTDLTVQENLNMGSYTWKDKQSVKKELEKVFKLFPILLERKHQRGGSLSGGEQQMLALARGLMANPKILLLDEPSLGLALLIVREIANIVKEVQKEGATILLVEQNANMALRLADFGYILETGSITLEDNAKSLLLNKAVKEAYLGGE